VTARAKTIIDEALGIDRGQAAAPGTARDPAFHRESQAWLAGKVCEVCGAKENLECHHEFPFHAYPYLEMDKRYWHALCRRPHDCHRLWGHFGDFALWNPMLTECIAIVHCVVGMAKAMLKVCRPPKGKRKA
jgi:hypothetical protein